LIHLAMAQKALPQDEIPLWTLIWTYQAFILGILLAHFRNFTSWLSVATGRSEEDPAFVCQEVLLPPDQKAILDSLLRHILSFIFAARVMRRCSRQRSISTLGTSSAG
jgi:hypothetical protein